MVKGDVIIKNTKLSLLVMILLLVGGCSEDFSGNMDEIKYFSTQEEALEHFMDINNIEGNIELVTTTKNELLLVTQRSQDIYFVGEIKENDEGLYAKKISHDVQIGIGASWELITVDGNEYTIYFETTNEKPNLIKLSNDEYFISVVEGHTLSDDSLSFTNAIKEVDTIKSNYVGTFS